MDPRLEHTQWFTEQVQPHESALRGYLHGAFPGVRDVDDVVQESFLRVWCTRATRPIVSARGLLFQVARSVAIDALRRGRVSPIDERKDFTAAMAAAPADDVPDARQAAALRERWSFLIEAVSTLPSRYREIVLLRRFEGLSQKEVAQRLGLSERTVENLLARGLRKCEEALRRKGAFEGIP